MSLFRSNKIRVDTTKGVEKMVHVTSGYVDETTRLTSYIYHKKNGYKPVTPHGTRYSINGRNTVYSKTSKAPKTKTAPAHVVEVHATTYTMACVNYSPIKAEYRARQEKQTMPIIGVKLIKTHRRKGAKTEN